MPHAADPHASSAEPQPRRATPPWRQRRGKLALAALALTLGACGGGDDP
ncbi:ABC transporter substrate-binding protein, partial [Cupriavidus taiwanensis]|nr:ABC transporter substrate-binding protein [Cupriavidus taiwanensis]